MKIHFRLLFSLLAFIFVFSLSSFLFAADQGSWEHAAELIQSGKSAEAIPELDALLAKEPGNVLYLRLKGIAELQSGKEDQAVLTLRQAVHREPTCVACGFYLAQALAQRGNVTDAMELLRVIVREVPDSRYAVQANKILPELERLASIAHAVHDKRRWNVTLHSGLEYDDNPINRSRHEGASPNSLRWIMSTYLEMRPIDQSIDKLPFTLGGGYAVYQSYHERNLGTLDLTSQTARMFVSHAGKVADKPYKLELKSDYTNARLANNPYSHDVSLSPVFDIQWFPWTMSSVHYAADWMQFDDNTTLPNLFGRDGMTNSAGWLQRFFMWDNRAVLDLTYDYTFTKAEGSQFNKQNNQAVGATLNLSLPWKLRWTGGVGYNNDRYGKFAPDPRRDDNGISIFSSLARPLFIPELVAELTYSHTTTESPQDFADTHRNVYGIGFSYYY